MEKKSLNRFVIFYILAASLIARIILLFLPHPIWWDSAVYIGMAKYIYTFGREGIFESVRPLVWPLILGIFRATNIIFVGRILEILFSLGIIFLTYKIADKLIDRETAVLSSIFIACSATFLFFSLKLYTEIPSTFFALLAIYFYLKNKYLISGIITAVAFQTKFPQGIIFIPLLFSIIIKNINLKEKINYLLGFIVTICPLLIFNKIQYGSFTYTFIEAAAIVKDAGIWIFQQPWHYYLLGLLKENIFLLFALPGIIFMINRRKYLISAIFILFLIYFSQMPHKEYRFFILFIPYICILAAYGIKNTIKHKNLVLALVLIISLVSVSINFISESTEDFDRASEYYRFLENKDIKNRVLISDPTINLYLKKNAELLYYPVFNSSLAKYWQLEIAKSNIDYIFINSCEGGLICPPTDPTCESEKIKLLKYLNRDYEKIYEKIQGRCEYIIFSS
ncbi:glycosyltransferase family 39 protein [Candidatus Woesearchaeota archaeon]|nr:glycosyltransferase family 39 protein [Candidatus Woesearchaeota archaeon]